MSEALDELIALIRKLRKECPWDRVQTLDTLKNSLIEEAYEVKDAIDRKDFDRLIEELGDLLVLILMHSEIAGETEYFDIDSVAKKACIKLRKRHPHIFDSKVLKNAEEVHSSWEESKLAEGNSILENIPKSLPALMLAYIVQNRAGSVGFDWNNLEDVYRKVEEELKELKEAKAEESPEARVEELGDLLFSIVNLSRFLEVDPEEALHRTVEKFRRRFRSIEKELTRQGRSLDEATLREMDKLWNEAKEREKHV